MPFIKWFVKNPTKKSPLIYSPLENIDYGSGAVPPPDTKFMTTETNNLAMQTETNNNMTTE